MLNMSDSILSTMQYLRHFICEAAWHPFVARGGQKVICLATITRVRSSPTAIPQLAKWRVHILLSSKFN